MTPFGIDHTPSPDPWEKLRQELRDSQGESAPALGKAAPEPFYELWHVGPSRFNGRDGQPLMIACLREKRTGKEIAVQYSRAYGLDSLRHAYAARLIDRPEGWAPVGAQATVGAGSWIPFLV